MYSTACKDLTDLRHLKNKTAATNTGTTPNTTTTGIVNTKAGSKATEKITVSEAPPILPNTPSLKTVTL